MHILISKWRGISTFSSLFVSRNQFQRLIWTQVTKTSTTMLLTQFTQNTLNCSERVNHNRTVQGGIFSENHRIRTTPMLLNSFIHLALFLILSPSPGYITIHYSDITLSSMASQITGMSTVCSNVCSGAHQRKHQRSAPLAFVRGIHRWPKVSPHKGPVTRKMFPIWWRHHARRDLAEMKVHDYCLPFVSELVTLSAT